MRNLAWRGSRRFDPRQRRWSGAPHMLVMAGKPSARAGGLRTAGNQPEPSRHGLPSPVLIAAHAERRGRRIWESRCLTDISRAGFGVGQLRSWRPGSRSGSAGAATPTRGWRHHPRPAGPRNTATPANSSYTATSGATKLSLRWTRSVKGSLAAGPGAERARLSGPQRADPGRMFAHGMGERRQRPAALVRAAVPGRRLRRPVVRRLRQPLRRPARGVPLLSRDAVDAVAAAGDRDASDPAVSRARATAGRRRISGQVLVFDAHRGMVVGSPMDLVEGVDPTDRDARVGRLRAGPAGLPGRRRARLLGGQPDGRCWASGSRAPRPPGWSG